jgi:glutamyl-tRNA reductase
VKQDLLITGISHRTAPVGLREQLAFADDEIGAVLGRLRHQASALSEAALLSTCNRVELIGVSAQAAQAAAQAVEFFAAERGLASAGFAPNIYRLEGREAVRHLFRVGASLDSMVVGEPQILGQLKAAYTQAAEAGSVGLILHRAFHRAFAVAKKVREQTLIGHGAVSVSTAAITLARQIFDSLEHKTVLLLGAGEMAEATARQLGRLGVESLLITNRTFDRAVALARALGGTAVPFDNFKPYLKIADVVIGSLATSRPLVALDELRAAMHERKYRPVFLIDLGVPRNFQPELNGLENVYVYDIDDLAAVIEDTRGERARAARQAEEIVELELEAFWRWLTGLDLVPAIKDIRANIERLRTVELDRHRAWLAALPARERSHIEGLTRGLVNKILHQIVSELRRSRGVADAAYVAEVARRLLGGDLVALADTRAALAGPLDDGEESED